MTSFRRIHLLDPPAKLSANGCEPGVVSRDKSGHIHMVAADADRDVSREDCRVLRYHLCHWLASHYETMLLGLPGQCLTEGVPQRSK